MALTFYGKKSCITCQKAKAFLAEETVAFTEILIETQPPDRTLLQRLITENGLKASLNTRSAIYKAKKLGDTLPDSETVLSLMLEDPNLIKRPVIVTPQGNLYVGFEAESLKHFLQS